MKPSGPEHRRVHLEHATPERPEPGEDLDPGRHRDHRVVIIIGTRIQSDIPADEHVVGPDGEGEQHDRRAARTPSFGSRRPAFVRGRDDLADDAEARQHHDVDSRVRVEPEDVLVHQDVAALARLKKLMPMPVEEDHELDAAMNGVATTTSSEVEKLAQTRSGIRKKFIPGARIVMIVTRKLSAVAIEEAPANWTPMLKKACPIGAPVDSGA